MEVLCKIIALLIWIGIELFIGYLIHFIPGTIGQVILIIYSIVAIGLDIIFATGLDEGDF